jgi:uncharacterized protein (TIGR02588 family)
MTERRKPAKDDGDTPLLEWICGGIGALLFLAVIGLLAGEGMKPPAPPDISGRVTGVEQQESRWLVTIEVRNAGDAAASVRIEVTSGDETRDLTVDFLATQAIATGAVYFDQRPVSGSIRVAITGYLAP